MQDYQQRVVDEHKELLIKANALAKFINSPKFAELDYTDRSLLSMQHSHMSVYGMVLEQRISRFKD